LKKKKTSKNQEEDITQRRWRNYWKWRKKKKML